MKKKIILLLCLVALLVIPIPRGTLDDGGTRIYAAATYKIVAWNRLVHHTDEAGRFAGEVTRYRKTSVYFLPDSLKPIDALWETESTRSKG